MIKYYPRGEAKHIFELFKETFIAIDFFEHMCLNDNGRRLCFFDLFINKRKIGLGSAIAFAEEQSKETIVMVDYNNEAMPVLGKIEGDSKKTIADFSDLDIYLFDESFSWAVAVTHTYYGDAHKPKRYCVLCDMRKGYQ
jgi:hypothetical protein